MLETTDQHQGTSAPLAAIQVLAVTPVSAAQASRAATPSAQWDLHDFAEFVGEEIERLNGPQLPCQQGREILASFFSRFGPEQAVLIARAAFEVYGGKWRNAPVTVRRFAQAHDDFFAYPILADLA